MIMIIIMTMTMIIYLIISSIYLSRIKSCFLRYRKSKLSTYFSQRCKGHCSRKHILSATGDAIVSRALRCKKTERTLKDRNLLFVYFCQPVFHGILLLRRLQKLRCQALLKKKQATTSLHRFGPWLSFKARTGWSEKP